MSAANVFLFVDRIVIWTDGASYDADGRLLSCHSKVGLLPHLNAALIVRGPILKGPLLTQQLGGCGTFDELVSALPATIANAVLRHRHVWDLCTHGDSYEVIVTGWSEERGQPESYRLKSIAPDDVEALSAVSIAPANDRLIEKMQAEFPGADDAILGQLDVGLRLIEMQRELRFPNVGSHSEIRGVGGFAQLTVIARDRIETAIVKRWPDRVGELMGRDIPDAEGRKEIGERTEHDPS